MLVARLELKLGLRELAGIMTGERKLIVGNVTFEVSQYEYRVNINFGDLTQLYRRHRIWF